MLHDPGKETKLKKYILNFSFNRKSRKNIFVYREIFFPQDRGKKKKRKSKKFISTRNFHLAKSKKKKLVHFTKDETTNISNAINVTRKFLSA